MGMTMSQKILAAHAGRESVQAGELIECSLDVVLGNDHVGRETMEYASDKWRPIPKGTLSDKIHDGITEFVKLQKGN